MNQSDTPIAQAIFLLQGDEFQLRGRSDNFAAEWPIEAERLCRGFGMPADATQVPEAMFAQPFGPAHVAIVQVSGASSGGIAFRLLVGPRSLYAGWIADPFLVSDRFPPNWSAYGDLEQLSWPAGDPALTTLDHLQKVLQTGGSQTLLGGVQALVDGGRLIFERPAPAPQLVRDLWQLLPYSTRAELWPATFAYSNALNFDVIIVPKIEGLKLERHLTEEQAVDYPEGRYELSLQYAVEEGNQREVDRLLHRRSSRQTLRLVLSILFGGIVVYLAVNFLSRFL